MAGARARSRRWGAELVRQRRGPVTGPGSHALGFLAGTAGVRHSGAPPRAPRNRRGGPAASSGARLRGRRTRGVPGTPSSLSMDAAVLCSGVVRGSGCARLPGGARRCPWTRGPATVGARRRGPCRAPGARAPQRRPDLGGAGGGDGLSFLVGRTGRGPRNCDVDRVLLALDGGERPLLRPHPRGAGRSPGRRRHLRLAHATGARSVPSRRAGGGAGPCPFAAGQLPAALGADPA